MSMEIAGSGVATTCALGLLKQLAARSAAQTEFIEYVREQVTSEFETVRAQRDHARDLACRYEAEVAHLREIVEGYRSQERLNQLSA